MIVLPGITIAGGRAKELIETFDTRQSADDIASYLQSHGQRHGRPENLQRMNQDNQEQRPANRESVDRLYRKTHNEP